MITIDHNKPRLFEAAARHINHMARCLLKRRKPNYVEFTASQHSGSFEVTVPVDAPETDTMIIVENPKISEMRDKVAGYKSINRFLRLRLASGQTQFAFGKEVEISIPYPDEDDDGVNDVIDNCLGLANPDQRDTDIDGFGNLCDADLNNDCNVNFPDLLLLKDVFFSSFEPADFNVDGTVNFLDLQVMKTFFFGSPGPSGTTGTCD